MAISRKSENPELVKLEFKSPPRAGFFPSAQNYMTAGIVIPNYRRYCLFQAQHTGPAAKAAKLFNNLMDAELADA